MAIVSFALLFVLSFINTHTGQANIGEKHKEDPDLEKQLLESLAKSGQFPDVHSKVLKEILPSIMLESPGIEFLDMPQMIDKLIERLPRFQSEQRSVELEPGLSLHTRVLIDNPSRLPNTLSLRATAPSLVKKPEKPEPHVPLSSVGRSSAPFSRSRLDIQGIHDYPHSDSTSFSRFVIERKPIPPPKKFKESTSFPVKNVLPISKRILEAPTFRHRRLGGYESGSAFIAFGGLRPVGNKPETREGAESPKTVKEFARTVSEEKKNDIGPSTVKQLTKLMKSFKDLCLSLVPSFSNTSASTQISQGPSYNPLVNFKFPEEIFEDDYGHEDSDELHVVSHYDTEDVSPISVGRKCAKRIGCEECTVDSDCYYCASSEQCLPSKWVRSDLFTGKHCPASKIYYAYSCRIRYFFVLVYVIVGVLALLSVITLTVVLVIWHRSRRQKVYHFIKNKDATATKPDENEFGTIYVNIEVE